MSEKCKRCGEELENADYFAGQCLNCEAWVPSRKDLVSALTLAQQEIKVLREGLKEVREFHKDCEGCESDCMWCHGRNKMGFEIPDEALKEADAVREGK